MESREGQREEVLKVGEGNSTEATWRVKEGVGGDLVAWRGRNDVSGSRLSSGEPERTLGEEMTTLRTVEPVW